MSPLTIILIIVLTPLFLYALGYFFAKGQMRAKAEFLKHELKNYFTKGEHHDRPSSRVGHQ